jgi:hypothetical protein
MDPLVISVSRYIQNGSESFGLNVLRILMLELEVVPPKRNSIGPYGFEYCFV